MFSVDTTWVRLFIDEFVDLLGEDDLGIVWGLSHKGLLWHDGVLRPYTNPFQENEPFTIGTLFDGPRGTLTFYKDGVNLRIAFTGLDWIEDGLYPLVCSPSIRTQMSLGLRLRGYRNLQDRCRAAIADIIRKID